MKLDLLRALPLALIACAAVYLAIVARPVPAERPAAVGEIDFDALYREASTALEALRPSRERKRKLVPAHTS